MCSRIPLPVTAQHESQPFPDQVLRFLPKRHCTAFYAAPVKLGRNAHRVVPQLFDRLAGYRLLDERKDGVRRGSFGWHLRNTRYVV